MLRINKRRHLLIYSQFIFLLSFQSGNVNRRLCNIEEKKLGCSVDLKIRIPLPRREQEADRMTMEGSVV